MADSSVTSPPRDVKILVIGPGQVGKTCLCDVYIKGKFNPHTNPTVFSSDSKMDEISSPKAQNSDEMSLKQVRLTIVDTAGQEDYTHLRLQMYEGVDVCVVCFDISDPKSFVNMEDVWLKEALQNNKRVLLCGTKGDLRDAQDSVKIKDIKQLIQKTSSHIADYMETSAKTQPEDPAKLFKRAAQIALFGLGEVQETSEWFQKSRLLKNCLCVCS